MLCLENVSKSYSRGSGQKTVLNGVNACLTDCRNHFGILGAKGSGKSTLMNIIAGVVRPDTGRVSRGARISWPLSWSGFRRGIAADEEVRLLARLHGICRKQALRFVAELSALDRKLYFPIEKLSRQERERLLLATAFALDFDFYMIDEALPAFEGDHGTRYDSVWAEKLKTRGLLFASREPGKLVGICPLAAILHRGSLSPFMPLAEAIRFFPGAATA